QESNPGPTDYKEDAFNIYISGLQIFLLRANALKATANVRSMAVITWFSRGRRSSIYSDAAFGQKQSLGG
ncbi:hypothetical protein PSYMP_28153, partial [Pseudomonas amygdali pv. morsprunorum str. M302280]|uniref:hypothetical protein n=1 Tax=Pseudomonas amygdali TaxID=47877 RepID=UPI000208B40F